MKKIVSLALSLVCMVALAVPAFAVDVSPEYQFSVNQVIVDGEKASNGVLTVTPSSTDLSVLQEGTVMYEAVEKLQNMNTLAQINSVLADYKVVAMADVVCTIPFEKVTVTFSLTGVKANQSVYALHYENGRWVAIKPDSVEDGKVTVTFTSLSPVAFVIEKDVTVPGGDQVKSPVTGGVTLGALGVLALTGASVFAFKKSRKEAE